jgi:two-component system NtrC family response regulator
LSGQNKTILIVEDDPGLQKALRWAFTDFEVVTAEDRKSAIAQLRRHEPQVVTLDLGLPPDPGGASEGLATLQELLSLAPDTKVIVVTGNNDRENAVRAIGLGAWLFFQKPVDPELLGVIAERAYNLHELEQENRELSRQDIKEPMSGIIATSPQMLQVCQTIEKVAPTDATTLLLGESGTGKELLARALHDLSPRAKQRFVAINCAAIPDALLESELFGYEKGAFTGAATSPVLPGRPRAISNTPMEAPCFWMRLVICRRPCRRSCCDFCRKGLSFVLVAARRYRWMCGLYRQPTRTWTN